MSQPAADFTPRDPQGTATKVIGTVVVVGAAVWILPTILILVIGMFPTVAAFFADRRKEKYAAFTVGLMNLCGVLPFALNMWVVGGANMNTATAQIGNVFNWLIMYGAAAMGWGIYYVTPGIVAMFLKLQIDRRIAKLQSYQQELIEEWGNGIAGAGEEEEEAA
jgi:predicted transporter